MPYQELQGKINYVHEIHTTYLIVWRNILIASLCKQSLGGGTANTDDEHNPDKALDQQKGGRIARAIKHVCASSEVSCICAQRCTSLWRPDPASVPGQEVHSGWACQTIDLGVQEGGGGRHFKAGENIPGDRWAGRGCQDWDLPVLPDLNPLPHIARSSLSLLCLLRFALPSEVVLIREDPLELLLLHYSRKGTCFPVAVAVHKQPKSCAGYSTDISAYLLQHRLGLHWMFNEIRIKRK